MARDGAGTYSLPQAPFVSGTVISSTAVNSDFSDIATALTQSLAKDGQTVPTANLPMGTYRHTGVGNASARDQYGAVGQVQDGSFVWCGTAGGTADALTLTPSPAITTYTTGQKFRFKASSSANTGAATVAISGLTTRAIQLNDAALVAGDIAANKYYEILYDGTAFQIQRVSVSVTPYTGGLNTIYVPAGAMVARTTNGAATGTVETTTNRVMLRSLDFDPTTNEFAQFSVRMPKSWNEGTVTAAFTWKHAATTVNFGVVWGIQGVALSDDDAADTAFGTAQTVTDTGGTTNDIYISATTSAVTIGGTPAAQDWVCFQVYRDAAAGGDTMAIDAGLLGVTLYYTTDAATDA